MPRSRWIYGLPGVLIAQLLAFTPIAFLVLIGVVQGISPSLEEASQTLRAKRWTTFRTVTLPLMRPGLANAFLLGFIESMADFGNPLVLGGNFEVLSTEDLLRRRRRRSTTRAAPPCSSIVLLGFTLGAFCAAARLARQARLHDRHRQGRFRPAAAAAARRRAGAATPSRSRGRLFTFVVYAIILVGGFVRSMGRDYTPTLEHYLTGFRIEQTARGLFFSGSAWNSFFDDASKVAALAAPLTAAIGLLTAYLLTRQNFAGQRAFEFGTHAELRDPRHGRRRLLHPRLQRAADRDHRHRLHPRDVLRVPQHAGRRARRHRDAERRSTRASTRPR